MRFYVDIYFIILKDDGLIAGLLRILLNSFLFRFELSIAITWLRVYVFFDIPVLWKATFSADGSKAQIITIAHPPFLLLGVAGRSNMHCLMHKMLHFLLVFLFVQSHGLLMLFLNKILLINYKGSREWLKALLASLFVNLDFTILSNLSFTNISNEVIYVIVWLLFKLWSTFWNLYWWFVYALMSEAVSKLLLSWHWLELASFDFGFFLSFLINK